MFDIMNNEPNVIITIPAIRTSPSTDETPLGSFMNFSNIFRANPPKVKLSSFEVFCKRKKY